MKIKLQILKKVTQSTSLDPSIIIDRIKANLDKEDYRVLKVTNNSVQFDDSPWKLMWNFQAVRRFDGGKFEINVQDNLSTVTLSYYRSLIAPVIILAAISVGLIKDGEYYAPLGFLSFYLIAITFNMFTLKGIAQEMLAEIIE
ncbi:MAG: hypothetical protein JWP44_1785 [Mucilaginibacter sp.]|nr:hypothetical protein [Mucilaginibacter sp.]